MGNAFKNVNIQRVYPQADTSELERQIDELVYQLYGLTKRKLKMWEVDDTRTTIKNMDTNNRSDNRRMFCHHSGIG